MESQAHNAADAKLKDIANIFVEMCKKSSDGIVDLKDLLKIVDNRKKRRIYDVTNVLEGVGLINKLDQSKFKWQSKVAAKAAMESEEITLLNSKKELEAEYSELYSIFKKFLPENDKIYLDLNLLEQRCKDANQKLFFADTINHYELDTISEVENVKEITLETDTKKLCCLKEEELKNILE
ncbi:MAG: Transcription factor e2f4 [Paramarteilia canceri]